MQRVGFAYLVSYLNHFSFEYVRPFVLATSADGVDCARTSTFVSVTLNITLNIILIINLNALYVIHGSSPKQEAMMGQILCGKG